MGWVGFLSRIAFMNFRVHCVMWGLLDGQGAGRHRSCLQKVVRGLSGVAHRHWGPSCLRSATTSTGLTVFGAQPHIPAARGVTAHGGLAFRTPHSSERRAFILKLTERFEKVREAIASLSETSSAWPVTRISALVSLMS